MSTDISFLAMRLEGPMQSWGLDSQYNRRRTGLMPTKSAIAGICAAACGISRGSSEEAPFLEAFQVTKMTVIAIPRKQFKERFLPVRRLEDYHTVQNTRRASGAINSDCVLTHRQYLTDAAFGVIIEGASEYLAEVAEALQDPVWGTYLGRKSCIPSAPVYAGLCETKSAALQLLIGEAPLSAFTRQEDVEDFSKGKDSLPDLPVSFASENRQFSPRRVCIHQIGDADSVTYDR